jgi:hypothetical protein
VLSVFGGAQRRHRVRPAKIAANYLSGFAILWIARESGALVTIDHYGEVTKLTARYLVSRAWTARKQSRTVTTTVVVNHSYSDRRGASTCAPGSYQNDVRALELMLEAATARARVLRDPAPAVLQGSRQWHRPGTVRVDRIRKAAGKPAVRHLLALWKGFNANGVRSPTRSAK